MSNKNEGGEEGVKKLVNVGSNIAGSAGGAVVGLLLGGPPGAIIGAALGPAVGEVFKKVGNDIAKRLLGPREEIRLGATMIFAIQKIDDNIKSGQQIRQDGFFKEEKGARSAYEELVEGVLLAAQREYQEKKIKFEGNLLANLVFHPEIDKSQGNMLIGLGQRLSYRQLCLLSIFAHKEKYNLRQGDYRGKPQDINSDVAAILQEIYQMFSEGILSSGGSAMLSVGDADPSKMRPQGIGATLHNLMELYNMDTEDLNKVAKILK